MARKVSLPIRIKAAFAKLLVALRKATKIMFSRPSIANYLMFSFILLSALGAGMIYVPAGLITAGVCCGLFGYLLGSE